ncbi:polysaccharide pyruvyl transferase family protein [Paraliobacillus zengyii]|uniref:polysaccharide pyruvyl transferase family protein n=1 Tax=Paraliobacillus zengyii TaxID=2213194 RepID=UPI0013004B91|nr:polysaccharide pyruvyl transferase family protein [Paraliobacillus zengyii]
MNNKTKVGIITFHRAINYGAVLQVFALQEKLSELGAEPYVLDYRNSTLEQHHKKMKLSDSRGIKEFIIFMMLKKNYNKKFNAFREFSSKYLNVSGPYYNLKDLEKADVIYDKFITGSDQVWNYTINNLDHAYFLPFTKDNSKKNSYAASFGVNIIPEEKKEEYYMLLKDFNTLLVRENQGAEIIDQLLNKNVGVVLDPTLLITKDKWLEIAKDSVNDRYILVYAFGGSKNIMEFAKKVANKKGYKIIVISSTYKSIIQNVEYVKTAGPEQFLGLFKNAEYVITNSFHGTVFSINLNKQFFTEFLPDSVGTNSRMEDVLELFNLKDRQLLNSDSSIAERLIDYKKVNQILEIERDKSIFLLKNII